jgi:hypothetical protein
LCRLRWPPPHGVLEPPDAHRVTTRRMPRISAIHSTPPSAHTGACTNTKRIVVLSILLLSLAYPLRPPLIQPRVDLPTTIESLWELLSSTLQVPCVCPSLYHTHSRTTHMPHQILPDPLRCSQPLASHMEAHTQQLYMDPRGSYAPHLYGIHLVATLFSLD